VEGLPSASESLRLLITISRASLHRTCVCKAFWRCSYLRTFSGADTEAFRLQCDWCIYGIRTVYGCLAVSELHASGGGPPSTVRPRDRFLSPVSDGRRSYEQGSKSTSCQSTCWDTLPVQV